jgi:hypothetical protein
MGLAQTEQLSIANVLAALIGRLILRASSLLTIASDLYPERLLTPKKGGKLRGHSGGVQTSPN